MGRRQDAQARLGWLLDGDFTVAAKGPNRKAADKTIAAAGKLKRFEPIDDALVTGFVMLAESVDNDPTNAALWREYRAAEVSLRAVGADDGSGALDKFLATLQTPVGDTAHAE